MNIHGLTYSESENHIFSDWYICVCIHIYYSYNSKENYNKRFKFDHDHLLLQGLGYKPAAALLIDPTA